MVVKSIFIERRVDFPCLAAANTERRLGIPPQVHAVMFLRAILSSSTKFHHWSLLVTLTEFAMHNVWFVASKAIDRQEHENSYHSTQIHVVLMNGIGMAAYPFL